MSNTLLYLAAAWPEPASSAAGTRSLQLLSLFLEAGWRITFMCAAEKRPHSAELPPGITALPLQLNDSRMDAHFASLQPDLVIFDRFMLEEQYGWRITRHCPQAKRLLDTIDLHSLRDIRQQACRAQRERQFSDWFCESALREVAAIHRSDLTLLISPAEAGILTRELQLAPELLHTLPFLLSRDEQSAALRSPGFHARRDFISIGNFRHPPNADAVRYLHDRLWPHIRHQCPDAALHLYGADLPPALKKMHRPENGFLLHGRAPDARAEMQRARVCLAPLRFGAGLKGKLLDAIRTGTPSVTSSIGAEGMQGGHPWPGTVTDDPDAFVQAALHLYQDPQTWQTAREPLAAVLQGFDLETHRQPFLERIDALMNQPPQSRPHQFTGALLRHHQHRSTEYLSRWIEAKNRAVIPTDGSPGSVIAKSRKNP